MLVREAKLKEGTLEQYQALDEAIRTGQFIRNKCLRLWMDAENCTRAKMHALCKNLATEFSFARKLNSMARQAHADRAWQAVKRFYENCRNGVKPVGYPKFKKHNLAKSISDAAWSQFTSFLDYYGKVFGKAVVAVNPAFTSQDCHHCGHRVKKSLSTRTHKCPNCGMETCRDTNAALNILKRGMEGLGREWTNNSTQGHWGTGGKPQTTGETPASADDEKSDLVSGVTEPVTA